MRFGIWSIQGLKTKQTEVFQEIYRAIMDLSALIETKKNGECNETVGNYIHFYSGVPKHDRTKRGVSIAIHKKLRRNVKSWEK